MSAVDEYRKATRVSSRGPGHRAAVVATCVADAAIAELEAENERLKKHGYGDGLLIEAGIVQQRRAEQAEAELAAVKARRCDGCEHDEVCEVAPAAWRQFEVQPFSCACWAERWPG